MIQRAARIYAEMNQNPAGFPHFLPQYAHCICILFLVK